MATHHTKKIGDKHAEQGTYLHRDNWEVMKPFVHFAVKAMAVIGGALWGIVKLAPKLAQHKEQHKKDGKIIKI